jgi:hypothetical protein
MMQPHYGYPAAYPQPFAKQPQRNVALIVVAAILLFIALGAGFVFAMNLSQYLTIEDKWANDPFLSPAAREFGVRIIQDAALKRMMVFGPASGLFGISGLVLGILGLRKK